MAKITYPYGTRCLFCNQPFRLSKPYDTGGCWEKQKVVTKRGTVFYFHKSCYKKNLKEVNDNEQR